MNKNNARLEHLNLSVQDPERSAKMLHQLFGWRIRWQGRSILGGTTYHVGNDHDYIALYAPKAGTQTQPFELCYERGGLNHIAVVVDDLEDTEKKVRAIGLKPLNHADYEPGRRFYFFDEDGIEWEVVSYRQ